MLSEKGKYASATENRRFVWKEIVWPLIIQVNNAEFTLIVVIAPICDPILIKR